MSNDLSPIGLISLIGPISLISLISPSLNFHFSILFTTFVGVTKFYT